MSNIMESGRELFITAIHYIILVVLPIIAVLSIVSILRDRSRNKNLRKDREQKAARVYVETLANQMTYKIQHGIPLSDLENVCQNKSKQQKVRNIEIPSIVVNRIITDEDRLRIAYNQYLEWLLLEYNKGHIGHDEYKIRLNRLNRKFDELLRKLRKSNWINWRE